MNKKYYIVGICLFMILYFCSKILLVKGVLFAELQILNQFLLLILLALLFLFFMSLEIKIQALSPQKMAIFGFLSSRTLEIYLVQSVLIIGVNSLDLFFPLNWIVVTALIIFSANVLHVVSNYIINKFFRFSKS